MILKSDTKFEEKSICCFKNDKNSLNFDLGTQISNICTVVCLFCAKYIAFNQKKYRGVIFNDTEKSCKIWRKTGLWFGKWNQEFGIFLPEHTKVSKFGLLLGPFIQSRKWMSLKCTRVLFVMPMKSNTKVEEEWTCLFKIDMKNLTNFDPSTRKSQKFTL